APSRRPPRLLVSVADAPACLLFRHGQRAALGETPLHLAHFTQRISIVASAATAEERLRHRGNAALPAPVHIREYVVDGFQHIVIHTSSLQLAGELSPNAGELASCGLGLATRFPCSPDCLARRNLARPPVAGPRLTRTCLTRACIGGGRLRRRWCGRGRRRRR